MANADDSAQACASEDEDPVAAWVGEARRRRRMLVWAGAFSIMGVAVNFDRILERVGPANRTVTIHELGKAADAGEHRYTGYMKQPEVEMKSEPGSRSRHKGAEGRMGVPTSKHKSGLYAMKGPAAPAISAERYAHVENATFSAKPGHHDSSTPRKAASDVSTFAIDVDTASYSNVRRHLLREHVRPPVDAVRTEELVNYFDYADAAPTGDAPVAVTTEVASCPWAPEHRLVRIGLRSAAVETTTARNFVFLVDVSGSMENDLPLVQTALQTLVERLGDRDRVAIVVYAGESGVVLPPTSGANRARIREAVRGLVAGGGTNGAAGIQEAYRLARASFVEGGVNRVVLATDGDFNVGVSSVSELEALIEHERTSGVFLSVLGFGTGNLNDETMERLADRGNGNYAYVDGPREAEKVLVREADATLVTIAKDVKIQVEFDPSRVARHRLVGYENRVLADRDFTDDAIDAGEIGAGHTVTALYEIEPVADAHRGALAEVRLRWKAPDADASELLTTTVRDDGTALADASRNLRFSAAVAMFGQKLRNVPEVRDSTYADIFALASHALGPDLHCDRREFLTMVHAAGVIADERMPGPVPVVATACEHPAMPRFVAMQRSVPYDWQPVKTFALEVLRLLPPLLALPLFVLAFVRRSQTRRRGARALRREH